MRRLTGALALAVVLSACQGGGRQAAPRPETASPTASATPSATPSASATPVVHADARRLRKGVSALAGDCPCGVFIRVLDKESDAKLEWYGVYDAARDVTVAAPVDDSARVIVLKGVTYYLGPETGRQWRRLDYRRLPAGPAKSTRLTLTAGLDVARAFTLGRTTLYPIHDSKERGLRWNSVSYDTAAALRAAGSRAPLLRRLVGDLSLYGAIATKASAVAGIHYDMLGPGPQDRHGISVWVEVIRRGERRLREATAPEPAPVLVVR